MKQLFLLSITLIVLQVSSSAQVVAGRMKEVFIKTDLGQAPSNSGAIGSGTDNNGYWEVTYLPGDDSLWLTENRTYRVRKMHPTSGTSRVILDLSSTADGGTFTPSSYRRNFLSTFGTWPQGGMAGLAIHPSYVSNPLKRFVYISYVKTYNSTAGGQAGVFFTNSIVRFTYNVASGQLESPVVICDTLPGSSDHNSQRLYIAPVGGTDYLFYGQGDMGAGQFGNTARPNKAQNVQSYEGKILRFNLEPDGDVNATDQWIPNDNPFNNVAPVTGQSAVWATGIRNNQGFAYANGILYGSSHGPFTDDEINIIQPGKNYGHPLVIGYSADNNYNGSRAATATYLGANTSVPLIGNETTNAATIGATYKDPIFSTYAASQATVNNLYTTNPSNGGWPSEALSGMDIYTNTVIPGWKNSLILTSLKWGRLLRTKLNSAGTAVIPIDAFDTVSYFGGTNRFRDLAIAPNGRDFYVVMDKGSTSSGPSAANPVVPACKGCIQKYTFIGYSNVSGTSAIPTTVAIDAGVANTCTPGTTVTIDATNNNVWVPITGPNGDIIAEIKANGNNLGVVNSSFFIKTGTVREDNNFKPYSNRNINISLPGNPVINVSGVDVRIYMTTAEYNALRTYTNSQGQASGIATSGDLALFKNSDPCTGGIQKSAAKLSTTVYTHGSLGYAFQANVTSFSTFYVAKNTFTTLPASLISFTGKAQQTNALLNWTVDNQENVSKYAIERSLNNIDFDAIGEVSSDNQTSAKYNYTDNNAGNVAATVYYRLKIIDQNGATKYSNIISVGFGNITENYISAFPNPAKEKTLVVINSTTEEAAQLKIVDNTGRTVKLRTINVMKGRNNFEMNLNDLPAGLYFIDVTGKTITQKIKLIKQ